MNIVAQVTQKLESATNRSDSEKNIDRAIELSDRYSSVKPKEYIVRLSKQSNSRPPGR